VWVADHTALRTQVVVKFIASDLKDSKDATERFSREAAAAAQVKSPARRPDVRSRRDDRGTPYIVMELLEGKDLGQFLEHEGKVPPNLVIELVVQLARALDRATSAASFTATSSRGTSFLCDSGRGEVFVKLLDFGIAKGVEIPRIDSGTKDGRDDRLAVLH